MLSSALLPCGSALTVCELDRYASESSEDHRMRQANNLNRYWYRALQG